MGYNSERALLLDGLAALGAAKDRVEGTTEWFRPWPGYAGACVLIGVGARGTLKGKRKGRDPRGFSLVGTPLHDQVVAAGRAFQKRGAAL